MTDNKTIILRRGEVILAKLDRENPEEYVTWKTNEDGHCFWGHYFITWEDAYNDFLERSDPAQHTEVLPYN